MFTTKYYNVEIPANTCEMLKRIENFKTMLIDNCFTVETSGCFDMVHFEIFIPSETALRYVNKLLNTIVWYDTL